jgi:uncharacterized protein YmfQ (DUF2313 family)
MSLDQQIKTLADFLPGGRLFAKKSDTGSNLYKLLRGLASEFHNCDSVITDFLFNIFPSQTEQLIDEWESVVGIPDSCFPGTGTIEERRTHVLVKLASLGVTSATDFEYLAELLGVTVEVTNGVDQLTPSSFPMTFPMVLDVSPIEADNFTMVFPFVLGGDTIEESKKFEIIVYYSGSESIIKCLFTKLKPAHCIITFIARPEGPQGCGDPLMQCGEPFALCGE